MTIEERISKLEADIRYSERLDVLESRLRELRPLPTEWVRLLGPATIAAIIGLVTWNGSEKFKEASEARTRKDAEVTREIAKITALKDFIPLLRDPSTKRAATVSMRRLGFAEEALEIAKADGDFAGIEALAIADGEKSEAKRILSESKLAVQQLVHQLWAENSEVRKNATKELRAKYRDEPTLVPQLVSLLWTMQNSEFDQGSKALIIGSFKVSIVRAEAGILNAIEILLHVPASRLKPHLDDVLMPIDNLHGHIVSGGAS